MTPSSSMTPPLPPYRKPVVSPRLVVDMVEFDTPVVHELSIPVRSRSSTRVHVQCRVVS